MDFGFVVRISVWSESLRWVPTLVKLNSNSYLLGIALEKVMAPYSSTLAWKIPWMEEPAWWAAVHGVAKSRTRLSDFTFTFHFHALEKAMATHSSVLAWRIPGMGEPGGLPYMESHRVRHDWSNLAVAAAEVAWLLSEIINKRLWAGIWLILEVLKVSLHFSFRF